VREGSAQGEAAGLTTTIFFRRKYMEIFQQVLSQKTLDEVTTELNDKIYEQCWRSSQLTWDSELLIGNMGSVSMTELSDTTYDLVMNDIASKIPKADDLILQYFVWHPGAGIAMHNDESYAFGGTIYLTSIEVNYGGFFIWEESTDDYRIYVPEFNSMVINKEQKRHMVVPVSLDSKIKRYTIQIFAAKS